MKVVIIGSGESGVGAALLAKQKGYEVFVSDYGEIPERYKAELKENSIPFEEKGHTLERLIDAGLVIKSPGVPETAAVLRSIREKGTEVISEIEFGYNFYSGKLIAITGSNGKTTTSGLIYHLLKTAGYDVAIGGNYGVSFARLLTGVHLEYMVLELSSFQLDGIVGFAPDVAVLLNISPDHLDRYDYDLWKYASAKMRITMNQNSDQHYIFNAEDEIIDQLNNENHPQGKRHPIHEEDYIRGIASKEDDSIFEITLKGKHNLFNARCAVEACRLMNVSESSIATGLSSFKNDPHRMEIVKKVNDVTFINDSKATNVDAVYYALEALEGPIIWIAGGVDKGNDYSQLHELVSSKVKALICLGVENSKLVQSFAEKTPIIIESTKVSNVVNNAMDLAESGDTVILSPACASFDLFDNYKDRGDQFKQAILKI